MNRLNATKNPSSNTITTDFGSNATTNCNQSTTRVWLYCEWNVEHLALVDNRDAKWTPCYRTSLAALALASSPSVIVFVYLWEIVAISVWYTATPPHHHTHTTPPHLHTTAPPPHHHTSAPRITLRRVYSSYSKNQTQLNASVHAEHSCFVQVYVCYCRI